jgi:hypothetical protein
MFFIVFLFAFSVAQFDLTDKQIHEFLKAKNFYEGDINQEWNDASTAAFQKWAEEESEGQVKVHRRKDLMKDWYWKSRVGAWTFKNNLESIRPMSLAVFSVRFDQGKCRNNAADASCSGYANEFVMEQARQHIYGDGGYAGIPGDGKNFLYYMAVGTRGLHRFETGPENFFDVSLPDKYIHSEDIYDGIVEALGYDPKDRFRRSMFLLPSVFRGFGGSKIGGLAHGRIMWFQHYGTHIYLHETGHTLGLGHSGAIRDGKFHNYYGKSSFMGGTHGGNGKGTVLFQFRFLILHY